MQKTFKHGIQTREKIGPASEEEASYPLATLQTFPMLCARARSRSFKALPFISITLALLSHAADTITLIPITHTNIGGRIAIESAVVQSDPAIWIGWLQLPVDRLRSSGRWWAFAVATKYQLPYCPCRLDGGTKST